MKMVSIVDKAIRRLLKNVFTEKLERINTERRLPKSPKAPKAVLQNIKDLLFKIKHFIVNILKELLQTKKNTSLQLGQLYILHRLQACKKGINEKIFWRYT